MANPHGNEQGNVCDYRKNAEQLLEGHFCDSRMPTARELRAFSCHQADCLARLEMQATRLLATQQKSEEAAQASVHAFHELALLIEPNGRIVTMSASAAETLGGGVGDFQGKRIDDLLPPQTARSIGEGIEDVLCSGTPSLIRSKQNETRLEGTVCPVFDATGNAKQLAVYIRDSSNKKEMLLALSESEARFFRLIQSMPDGVVVANAAGLIEYVNPAWQSVVVAENAETNIADVIAADHRRHFQETFRRAVESLLAEEIEAPDVSRQWWRWTIVPLALHGRVESVAMITHNTTAERRAEGEIMAVGELEEQRIGQDLHDGLGQELMGLGYMAETLRRRLNRKRIAESGLAEELVGGIESALDSLRGLARGLVGMERYPQGLPYALNELAASIGQHSRISCCFQGKQNVTIADAEIATHLFRITQEATNNAVKHSMASGIEISLKETRDHLVLRISDNGTGMPENPDKSEGLGLRNMRHRARVIGATFRVLSDTNKGTTVECSLNRSVSHSENSDGASQE